MQEDLAWSLTRIAREGPDAFYRGAIAERLAADMRRHGGPMRLEDLAAYEAVVREPVRGTYRGYTVYSMPPPSSGGVHLVQILNMLEGYPLAFLGPNSADTIHVMAEAMKLAYADRSEHLGDPDFRPVPVAGLTSKYYAASLRDRIDLRRARPSADIRPGDPLPFEGEETTHFSVMDREGNVVSNTYTLNFAYGSGIVAAGTGILLNNEMDDFSAKPGVPNAYGLVGGRGERGRRAQAPLELDVPDHRVRGRRALPRHRQPRREPDHHHHLADPAERHRPRHEHRRRHRDPSRAPSVAARPAPGRARHQPRHPRPARPARPPHRDRPRDGQHPEHHAGR